MSLIQNIRDKYARWAVVAIALSLLGFILMDAFSGRGSVGGSDNTVGKVAGEKIEVESFNAKVEALDRQQGQQGQQGEAARQQVIEQVWTSTVDSIILQKQFDELGMEVSDVELRDMLYGANPPDALRQAFTDPQTGVYNPAQAQKYISDTRNSGQQSDRDQINYFLNGLALQRLENKYTSLLTNTIYFPKWFLEKRNTDNSLIAKVSYVSIPYASISDSAVKVTNEDIQNYINKHKDDFQQLEETRNISYVSFSFAPSAQDSAAARQNILELRTQFDTTSNYETFLTANSAMPFYDGFVSSETMQQPNKDSILGAGIGVIYGPYLDANPQGKSQYVISKIIASRSIPDTVSARHLLIATQQQTQGGGMVTVRTDEEAKRLIDSLAGAIRAGASFDSLVARFSEDPGSKDKGGKYESITSAQMVPSFNDFIFTNPVGTSGVVKTSFGYHFIEVLSQKGSAQGYKIAYLGRPIESSDETRNNAQNAATQFAGNSLDANSFNANWEENLRRKGINRLTASDIRKMDYSVQGMTGTSRKLIREVFDADQGDVVGPEEVGEAFVVALVTGVNEEGLASVETARASVEPIIRNQKKAAQIKQNIGQITTLEDVARKTNQQVSSLDSVRFSGANNVLGYEPRVLGASFNPANKGKVVNVPIEGQLGIYVLRVENTGTVPVETASIPDQRRMMEQQQRQQMMQQMQYGGGNPFIAALRKDVEIKDNRGEFY